MFSETFKALIKEAQLTNEMLGSGATQIRKANYATKGIYFQAFTSLSTGLERIGKLCLMLDHYLETGGKFPHPNFMKNEIGHDIAAIYGKSASIIKKHSISLKYSKNLDTAIHQNILEVLSGFAQGDRYSNINILIGIGRQNDSIALWFEKVDQLIFQSFISAEKKAQIEEKARMTNLVMGLFSSVLHISEGENEITNLEEASYRTGMWKVIAPYRQLFVLQIIRFWVELLWELQYGAMRISDDIPAFSEIFALFYNPDSYFRTRKTWEKI